MKQISYLLLLVALTSIAPQDTFSAEEENPTYALIAALENSDIQSTTDYKIFRRLLKNGANPNIPNKDGMTALMIATEKGFSGIVGEIIREYKGDTSLIDGKGRSLLMIAATSLEGVGFMEWLIYRASGCINHLDNDGNHLIYYALKTGKNIESTHYLPNTTKTIFLLLNENKEHLEKYVGEKLNFEFDATHLDKDGNSLLHIAAQHFNAEMVGKLFKLIPSERKSEILNLQNKSGMTPLMLAANALNDGATQMLLLSGAAPNLLDGSNQSALVHAVLSGDRTYNFSERRIAVINALLLGKANPNATDDRGMPILMRMPSLYDSSILISLLLGGANPDLQDKETGVNALMEAVLGSYVDAVRILTPRIKNMAAKNLEGKTALEIAEAKSSKDQDVQKILQILKENGAK